MFEKKVVENSNIRKIVAVLVKNQPRYFSVKELSIRSGMALGMVRSSLKHLSKRGLLNQADKIQQKYYKIKTSTNFFSEFFERKDRSRSQFLVVSRKRSDRKRRNKERCGSHV